MEDAQPMSTAATALRDSFGDRKIPDISRKITACVACRKQKIKCHMNESPPCTRCKKRGLPCTVNKSLQMILESDVSWKDSMEQRMRHMEEMIERLADGSTLETFRNNLPHDQPLGNADGHFDADDEATASTQAHNQSPCRWEVVMDSTRGPGGIPASYISEVSATSPASAHDSTVNRRSDIISEGLISLATVQTYFSLYHQRLDHFVYNILAEHDSLASIRARSSLLIAVVSTVSALYSASSDYEVCYQAFRKELASRMFAKDHTFDDVRALCIGAFWLSDMSWSLVGAAVRIATEINLHRCITKIPHVKKECYVRTRLYFCVYVVDHQTSVAYGRPPMTREFDLLSSPMAFLDSEFATEDDARLVSQLELWSINSRIFDTFGVDPEMPVPPRLLPHLQRLSIALDTWRVDWNDRLGRNKHMDSYQMEDVGLHFHFARLYLYSHVFRGPHSEGKPYPLGPEMEEFANAAIVSASSIIRVINVDQETKAFLGGLPTYFDTMVAFAAVFLLKLTYKPPTGVRVDKEEILSVIGQLVTVLRDVTIRMHTQHLLSSIAASIGKLLERMRHSSVLPMESDSAVVILDQVPAPPGDQDWMMSTTDPMFLGNYDFLWPQDINFDFDFADLNSMPAPA